MVLLRAISLLEAETEKGRGAKLGARSQGRVCVLDFHRLGEGFRIFDIVFCFFGVCEKGVFNGEM